MRKFTSNNVAETKKLAVSLAGLILKRKPRKNSAEIIALEGELGAGKTTFAQAFAKALGIKEKITSPTFLLIKIYDLSPGTYNPKRFVHIDCYRLDSPEELVHLGFEKLLKDKDAIVMIEWADRIRGFLPKDTTWIRFKYGEKQWERLIKFKI